MQIAYDDDDDDDDDDVIIGDMETFRKIIRPCNGKQQDMQLQSLVSSRLSNFKVIRKPLSQCHRFWFLISIFLKGSQTIQTELIKLEPYNRTFEIYNALWKTLNGYQV